MTFFDDEPIDVTPKPWMPSCKFVLVTPELLPKMVDLCIESGRYSLDLETTGLNRNVTNGKTHDDIVGVCISPDGVTGYYVPVRHKGFSGNIPWETVHAELTRLCDSNALAIFHNSAFDQEFLQFNGISPIGDWSNKDKFEDTMILAYLFDSKGSKSLKALSKLHLNREMIELDELFRKGEKKDFSELDPTHMPVLWYAGSDAICTYNLYFKLKPSVVDPPTHSQKIIYAIEKACVDATRSMERNLVCVDTVKVRELITVANRELLETLEIVYGLVNANLGRDTRPNFLRIVMGVSLNSHVFPPFDPNQTEEKFDDYLDRAKKLAKAHTHHTTGVIDKHVPSLTNPSEKELVSFPEVYDIFSATQLGHLLRELGAPVTLSEKGNIQTGAKELDELLEKVDDSMSAIKSIGKLRSVTKAFGTYLYPLLEDSVPHVCEDGETRYFLRAGFNQFGTDTGRFSARTGKKDDGATSLTFHGIPARMKPGGSVALGRIRECIYPRKKTALMVSCDFSGVELRIASSFSMEPKWVAEFFRCSTCGYEFDKPTDKVTPDWIDAFCVKCGSDKVGDIHTLTALNIFGDHAYRNDAKLWKEQRGIGKCMVGSTWVRTSEGVRTLESIKPEHTQPDTFYRQSLVFATEAGWEESTYFYDGGVKPTFKVVLESGIVFEGTAVHPIRVMTKKRGVRVPAWKQISDLKTGDSVIVGKGPSLNWAVFERDLVEYRKGLTWNYRGEFSGESCADTAIISQYADVKTLQEWYPHWKEIKVGTRKGLEALPQYPPCDLSAIPYTGDENKIMNFVLGVLDANATIRTDGRIIVIQKEYDRLAELRKFLSAFGFRTRYRMELINGYERHVAEIKHTDLQGPIRNVLANQTSQGLVKGFKDRKAEESAVFTEPVLAIIPAGENQVWDIHVPGSHSFWADGIIAHNTTNFALAYGGSANSLIRPGVTEQEAQRQKQKFDESYTVLRQWWDQTKAFGRQHGYVLTAFGRRYPLPDIQLPKFDKIKGMSNGRLISAAERNAVNSPVQGCLHPNTRVITDSGMTTVGDLWKSLDENEQARFKIWTGCGWSDARVFPTGGKRLCHTRFHDGNHIETSPDHRFRVWREGTYSAVVPVEESLMWVRQEDLVIGDNVATDQGIGAQRYRFSQVTALDQTDEFVDMFDIEVFDGDHAFSANGVIVHNSSADITKIGMVYVNRLIRERGWQGKVMMLMTIHDELVFEIDLDILEEACDEITKAMTRNPMVLSLKWPIPLTSDTELGPNWTVKYNLIAMRKGEKEWPDWLAPYFKQKKLTYYTSPSQGHEFREFHLGDLKAALEEKAVGAVAGAGADSVSTAAATAAVVLEESSHESENKPLENDNEENPLSQGGEKYLIISGGEIVIRLPRLDLGFLNDLAYCIDKADGTGKIPVKFVMDNGEDVTNEFIRYFKRGLRVDVEVLRAVMKTRDFV